jgi:hypothetical protein
MKLESPNGVVVVHCDLVSCGAQVADRDPSLAQWVRVTVASHAPRAPIEPLQLDLCPTCARVSFRQWACMDTIAGLAVGLCVQRERAEEPVRAYEPPRVEVAGVLVREPQ